MSEDSAGRFVSCQLCGEFHFDDVDPLCLDCAVMAHDMRSAIEKRGGSLVIVGDQIVVRTAVQLRDPEERWKAALDVQRAIAESPHLTHAQKGN